MELLQNRRYKPDEIPNSYCHEIRMQMESILELCQEGEISVYEAINTVNAENICSLDYRYQLWEMLENFENDIKEDFTVASDGLKMLGWKASYSDFIKEDLEKTYNKMNDYNSFVVDTQNKLCEILENADYQKKRKAKIKLQIIREGLTSPLKKEDREGIAQESKLDVVGCYISQLVTIFPEFANDYLFLIEKGFIEKTENGLRKGRNISKKFLTDYFKSVKRPDKKEIPWSIIESIFEETMLRQSAKHHARKTKDCSIDFEKWQEIKKSLVSK